MSEIDTSRTWKKRPSEIRGYSRAYYINTSDRDYIRVDYSLRENKLRFYVEVSGEGGNSYYSVIENGSVTIERSVATGRTFGFEKKFQEYADIVNTLPNNEVLDLFNSHYGIVKNSSEKKEKKKKSSLEDTKKKYFAQEKNPYERVSVSPERKSSYAFVDVFDFIIGVAIVLAVFWYSDYSYIMPGVVAAFFGMFSGFFDMFFREREPVFTKILLFLASGVALYVYGYFM